MILIMRSETNLTLRFDSFDRSDCNTKKRNEIFTHLIIMNIVFFPFTSSSYKANQCIPSLSLSPAFFILFIPRFFQVVLNISFIVHQLTSKNEYIHTHRKQTYLDASEEQKKKKKKETFSLLTKSIAHIDVNEIFFRLIREIISLNPN